MRALVVLTPSESKKLIGKAVLAMEAVKKARESGTVVIHPSSSTFHMIEELRNATPEGLWVCGIVVPRGMCIARENFESTATSGGHRGPGDFPHAWVVKGGQVSRGDRLIDELNALSPEDVYIKGVNALDPEGNVGVLVGNRTGGTIGVVVGAAHRRGFQIIAPTSLAKYIPIPIREAAQQIGVRRTDKTMGLPVSLMRIPAKVVTEVDAFKVITGADAVVVAAGGLGGGEGALSFALRGTTAQVEEAYTLAESVKGARVPSPNLQDCRTCPRQGCNFRGRADGGFLPVPPIPALA